MLVDFTVRNFRSFKTEQLFSLFAENKPKFHGENVIRTEDGIGVLRSCGLYGANAAGKSNLIQAIEALSFLVLKSAQLAEGDEIEAYQPYLLDEQSAQQNSLFDIEFICAKQRFSYQIEFNRFEIVYEKLSIYVSTRSATLFERSSARDYKKVKFGERYKGGKRQFGFFANNSYLSKAGSSPESPSVVQAVYLYFRQNLQVLMKNELLLGSGWQNNESIVAAVNQMLSCTDLGIERFAIEEQTPIANEHIPKDMSAEFKHLLLEESKKREVFYHRTTSGKSLRFERSQQSQGTLRMFNVMPLIFGMLQEGRVFFIDEIESSFHPHIAELIVKLFNDPSVNTNGAQLIYTTHDVSLMSSSLFRKDQIYFVEKSVESGSRLYNLETFDSSQLKDTSPFGKWYEEGRLGGVPNVNYKGIADVIRGGIDAKKQEESPA